MLLVVLVIAHVLFAAAWFGLSLSLPALVRGMVEAPGGSIPAVGARVMQSMTGAAVVWYLTALAAFFAGGGFSAYGPTFHTALLLGLVIVLIQVLVLRPSWAKLADGDASVQKRMSMWLGIGHLLWFVILVLMFFGPRWAAVWAV